MQFNRFIHSTTRLLQRRTFPRTKHTNYFLSSRFEHSGSSTSTSINTNVKTNQIPKQVDFPFIATSQEPDETLRLIFDDSDIWNNFISRSQTLAALEYGTTLTTRKLTGLFRNPELATPQGFHIEAEKALRRVKLLVNRITNANTEEELRKVVKNLDRLSNALCSVIDMAEFIRTSHPDPKFAQAANWAYEHL